MLFMWTEGHIDGFWNPWVGPGFDHRLDCVVGLNGDSGTWHEIFNSQAPLYGGVNTVGNPGYALTASNGQLWINLSMWSVRIFVKR